MFNEKISILWWLGTFIVIIGVLFILAGTEEQENKKINLTNKDDLKKQAWKQKCIFFFIH